MTDTILPHELPTALGRAAEGVKVLSLDCFDTLLWRDCHAPTDVFAGLQAVSTGQRIVAETNARKVERTLRRRGEVTIEAIYEHALTNGSLEERRAAVGAELEAEARACFAFAPTVELMREAKANGLSVVIASDTYLSASQLLALIEAAAGAQVAGLIDRVFVSSEAGISKSEGLLSTVLKALKCRADEMLHIGDNKVADFDGARALGISALHLRQFNETARQRLRFERACQQIAGETGEGIRGLQPHRALISQREPITEDSSEALGFTALGPVFHAFEEWLRGEAEALANERGGTIHWLFMLRDGHLPFLVHQAAGGLDHGALVEISRFTATAASLTTKQAYRHQFAAEHGLNPSTLARQMLFTEDEIESVIGDARSDTGKIEASERLLAELRNGQRQKLTQRRARGFADRLIAHIRAAVDPQPGDTLMLVDLGYNGSAQNRIDALLREALDVHVAGRYLLLREMAATGLDKRGLIDARHYSPEFLEALCGNVAVLEQLATCELGSVTDYTDKGEPIRKDSAVKGRQSDVRIRVQRGVVAFAEAAQSPPIIRDRWVDPHSAWREAACGALTRFMFLPQPHELEVVKSFEHDVNLGSDRMVALFNTDRAREGMRRRGLFYMKGSSRMYLPAELARADLGTRLSLLVQKRFGLGFTYDDHSPETIEIPVMFMGKSDGVRASVKAQATHDGFFAARVPISESGMGIALQIGAVCEWVELASITSSPVRSLRGGMLNDTRPEPIGAHYDGIRRHTAGILECTDTSGVILMLPGEGAHVAEPGMIEIVFRPLKRRAASAAARTNPGISIEERAA